MRTTCDTTTDSCELVKCKSAADCQTGFCNDNLNAFNGIDAYCDYCFSDD